jgi:hypothetical protein
MGSRHDSRRRPRTQVLDTRKDFDEVGNCQLPVWSERPQKRWQSQGSVPPGPSVLSEPG